MYRSVYYTVGYIALLTFLIKEGYDVMNEEWKGLLIIYKGHDNINSKLSVEDTILIKNNYKPRDKEFGCRALAKRFNVSHATISYVINNKTYL